ncbi:conjugal transfer protein TraF [Allohahella marinimesophila]
MNTSHIRFKTLSINALATCLTLNAVSIQAAPRGFTDARSLGMGRTGIAIESPLAAPFLNPALLAMPGEKASRSTKLLLPSLRGSAAMDEDLVDDIDDFQDNDRWDEFVDAVDAFNGSNSGATEAEARAALANAIDKAKAVDTSLGNVDREALQLRLGLGTALSRTGGDKPGYAVFASTNVEINGISRYNDSGTVNAVIDAAEAALEAADSSDPSGLSSDLERPTDDPQSNASVLGIAVAEVGIAYAHNIRLDAANLQLGVAPKLQHVRTFDYTANANSFDENDFDAGESEEQKTVFNMDLGASAQFDHLEALSFALVIKNIVPHEFDTAGGNTMELNPLVQAGAAYTGDNFVVTAELDLTRSEGVGFEGDRQLLAVGGEFSPLDWLHLRGGVSKNLKHGGAEGGDIDQDTLVSAGLGFSPGSTRIDLAAFVGESTTGAAFQLGFLF